MDAKQVMSERCNGNSSCSWNPEEIQLSDPCPNVFKYMTVNYKCDAPVVANDARMTGFESFDFENTSEKCTDQIGYRLQHLVDNMDQIASLNSEIYKGWFGNLSYQKPADARKIKFPKNLAKVITKIDSVGDECDTYCTESAHVSTGNAYAKYLNAYDELKSLADNLMSGPCSSAAGHLTKKLRHSKSFLEGTERNQGKQSDHIATFINELRRRK